MADTALQINLADEAATVALAQHLAQHLRWPFCLLLAGDLGMGKTALARAFIRAKTGAIEVTSPTFTLVQTYSASAANQSHEIWHFDLYRLKHTTELEEIGWFEALAYGVVVEWPHGGSGLVSLPLPQRWLRLDLAMGAAPNARIVTLTGPLLHELNFPA